MDLCNDCCSAVHWQIDWTGQHKMHVYVCIDALIIHSIHIKQTSNVCSDNKLLGTKYSCTV